MFESGDMPDGILTSNNRTSIGFVKAAKDCRIKIGVDIGVVGIDHVEMLDLLGYELSCATRNTKKMGKTALDILLERIANPDMGRKIIIVPYELNLKGSEKKQ